jgi:hypothetical protein
MFVVDAATVPADMMDMPTFQNRPVFPLKRKPVRRDASQLSIAYARKQDSSVAVAISASHPDPTRVGLVNASPEEVLQRFAMPPPKPHWLSSVSPPPPRNAARNR